MKRTFSHAPGHLNMPESTALRSDPYALAYRYWDYIRDNPRRKREGLNPYYENLLANQPEPDEEDKDDRSCAIRYAKEHYECFYEVRDIKRIIQWLEKASG
jgi:hypothetical protein